MKRVLIFIMLLACSLSAAFAQRANVTNAEWFTGTDPGVGSATPITIGAPAPTKNLAFSVATASFTTGAITRVHIRCRADSVRSNSSGVWGPVSDMLAIISSAAGTLRLVTQMSYQIDNGSFTNVDVTDAPITNLAAIIPTTGMSDGLHRVRVRATDDLGRTGVINDGFLVISNTTANSPRVVTHIEYWLDSDAPTTVDVADAGIVNWNTVIPTASLAIGLHTLNVRARDDLGRTGKEHRIPLIISSPFVLGQSRTITAAEYWLNVDPGAGNGVAIPLPNDGAYDEGIEDLAAPPFSSLPVGSYIVGFRTQDNTGRWSQSEIDSFFVGPLVVIRPAAANSVTLDWSAMPGATSYNVYRNAIPTGAFTQIATPGTNTYTDTGITSTQIKQFYYVTAVSPGLSPFHMPDTFPVRD